MRNYFFFAFFLSLLLIQSCTLESETHFNRKGSGSHSFYFEMPRMQGENPDEKMPSTFDSLFIMWNEKRFSADSMNLAISDFKEEMSNLGIKNFVYKAEEKGIRFNYDFEDLSIFDGKIPKILDKYFEDSDVLESEGENSGFMMLPLYSAFNSSYKRDGSWFCIDLMSEVHKGIESGDISIDNDDGSGQIETMVLLMGSTFKFKSTYSFYRKIKEIHSDIPYVQKENAIVLEYSFRDLMELYNEGKEGLLKIKL